MRQVIGDAWAAKPKRVMRRGKRGDPMALPEAHDPLRRLAVGRNPRDVCLWDLGFGVWGLGFGVWDFLESKQPRHLHHERPILQTGESGRGSVAAVGVDDEQV